MRDLSKKFVELEEAIKRIPQKGDYNPTPEDIALEKEFRGNIEKLESILDKRFLPRIVDKEPFYTEQLIFKTLEWFLFKDNKNSIKVLYKEETMRAAEDTKYRVIGVEHSVFDWSTELMRRINERLPTFIDLIIKESKKYKQ